MMQLKTISNKKLWMTINSFNLKNVDEGYIVDALKEETDLSDNFISSMIEEYKKFIYLTCITTEKVIPSQLVYKVWKLHQAHAENYQYFCEKILKQHINLYKPIRGQAAEKQEAIDYKYTLTFYKKEFGISPPNRVWNNSFHLKALFALILWFGVLFLLIERGIISFFVFMIIAFLSTCVYYAMTGKKSSGNYSDDEHHFDGCDVGPDIGGCDGD